MPVPNPKAFGFWHSTVKSAYMPTPPNSITGTPSQLKQFSDHYNRIWISTACKQGKLTSLLWMKLYKHKCSSSSFFDLRTRSNGRGKDKKHFTKWALYTNSFSINCFNQLIQLVVLLNTINIMITMKWWTSMCQIWEKKAYLTIISNRFL